ncbi:MAG: hypothetical protein SGPRY_011196 [Prymnesium sp.]
MLVLPLLAGGLPLETRAVRLSPPAVLRRTALPSCSLAHSPPAHPSPSQDAPVVVLGASGYIGKAVVRELVSRGHNTVSFVRPGAIIGSELDGSTVVEGDVEADEGGHLARAITGARGVISCISSRSGERDEVWRVDYGASERAMRLLQEHGTADAAYVLLSAICVKNPVLHLHRAKLAAEEALAQSGISYAIVRPSAYFKSISAQVPFVTTGRPYVLFGDGTHTKCNAIGERDLASCLVDSLENADSLNGIIEIGGPGDPISPRQQSQLIFERAGLEPKYVYVPLSVLETVVAFFEFAERVLPALASDAAESARIAKFYATEDMLGPSDPRYSEEKIEEFYASAVSRAQESSDENLGLPASSVLASSVLSFMPPALSVGVLAAILSSFDPLASSSSPQLIMTSLASMLQFADPSQSSIGR